MAKSYSSIKPLKGGSTYEDDNKPKKSYKDIKASDYDFGVDDDYIKSYFDDLAKYSSEAEKDFDSITYGSDVSGLYDKHSSQASSLRERGAAIRAYLNSQKSNLDEDTYNEFIEALDSHDKFTADTSKAFQQKKDFYTTFKTQYDYDTYTLNNTVGVDGESVSTRKSAYDSLAARLAEIEDELNNSQYGGASKNSWITKFLLDYAATEDREKYSSLVDERDKLQAELTKYERGNKNTDDLYSQFSVNEDWEEDSKNRDFNRPTSKDIYQYGNFKRDENGNGTGERYDIDESLLAMEDPLGTYFAKRNDEEGYGDFLAGGPMLVDPEENDRAQQYYDAYNDAMTTGEQQHWEYLTEDEINLYYYMLSNDMKDQALSYLAGMETELDRRSTVEYQKELEDAGALELVFHNIVSVPANIAGGVIAFADDAINIASGKDINPYGDGHSMQNYAQGVRAATANDINRLTGASEDDWITWGDAYQGLMSGADSIAGAYVLGGGYTIVMGMGGAASEAKELYEKGASREQIIAGSLLAGTAEAAFETISIGYFLDDVLGKPAKSIGQWLYKTLGMAGVEATEEFCTTIANYISDATVRGGASDWAALIEDYTNAGYSDGEAIWKAIKDVGGEALHDGAIGAISGGGMGSVGNTVSGLKYNSAAKAYGQQIIDAGGVDSLKTLALDMAGEQKGISNFANKVALKQQANKASKADTTSNRGKKAVGVLADTVNSTRAKQNKADIVQSLQEKGVSKAKATQYADILFEMNEEYFTGKARAVSLGTDEQWQEITGDSNAYAVLREVVADMDSSVNTRNTKHRLALQGIKVNEDGTRSATEEKVEIIKNEILKEKFDQKAKDVKATVSQDGKAKVIDDNTETEVTLQGIDHIETKEEDGQFKKVAYLKAVDSNGKESVVDWNNVEFGSRTEGVLYESFVGMGIDPVHFDAFVKNFNEADFDASLGEAAIQYAEGFSNAYRYGWANMENELSGNVYASKLTDTVRNTAYTLGKDSVTNKAEAQQKALDEAVAQRKDSGKGKVRTKGELHMDGVKSTKYTDLQKAGLELAEKLTGLGIDVYVYESHKNAKGEWVDDRGELAENGFYRTSDGSIHVDLNAGKWGDGLVAYTLSHELSHFMRQYAPKEFKAFADILFKWYGEKGYTINDLVSRKMIELGVDEDTAYEEVVADSCESFLTDSNIAERLTELQQTDKNLLETIRSKVLEFLDWMKSLFADVNPDSAEGAFVRQFNNEIDHLYDAFYNTLASATETYQWVGSIAEAKTNAETLATAGITMDANTGSAVMNSVRYAPKTQAEIDKVAKALSETMGVSIEKAKAWVKSETSLTSIILDPSNEMFLDYEADERYEAIKKNAEYPQGTVDFSNLCKKRREFTALLDKLQKEHPNRIITAAEMEQIRQVLIEENVEVACGLCYVEERRQLLGEIAQGFIDGYKDGTLKEGIAKELDAKDSYVPTIYDLITYDGYRALTTEHPSIAKAFQKFNNARGMQAGRLIEGLAEYKRDIRKWSQKKVDFVNSVGGLRVFSFSDFEATHLIDLVQVIQDCAAKGVMIQAYTKVPAFANAVKDTNMKVNRSLIAKGTGIKYENGRMVLDLDPVEGIDINDKDFFDSTDSKNVGNVLVGMSNEQIRLAMKTPFVDYIIPFHTSLKGEILGAKKIDHWDNYKNFQTDKEFHPEKVTYKKDGSVKSDGWVVAEEQINIYTDVIQAAEAEGKPIKNKVDFVNKFLAVAKEKGLKPRFWQFLDVDANGEYTYTEGYHKFLVDFKLFDQQGNILPQEPVVPEFDDALNARILNEYVEGKKMPAPRDAVYDRLVNEVINGEGIKHSSRKSLAKKGRTRYDEFASIAMQWARSNTTKVGDAKIVYDGRRGKYVLVEASVDGYIETASGNYERVRNLYEQAHRGADTDIHADSNQARTRRGRGVWDLQPAEDGGHDVRDVGLFGSKGLQTDSARDNEHLRRGNQEELVKKSSRRDSSGRELSKGQQDFFKDSKIRDFEGNLLKLYHGTRNGGFTKFNAKYSDDGITLFLTPDAELAKTYSGSRDKVQLPEGKKGLDRLFEKGTEKPNGQVGLYEVYANAKNPYILVCDGANWNNLPFKEKVKGKSRVEAYNRFDRETQTLNTTVEVDGKFYEKVFDFSRFDEQARKKVEQLERDGYDIAGWEYNVAIAKLAREELAEYYNGQFNEETARRLAFRSIVAIESQWDNNYREAEFSGLVDNKTGEVTRFTTRNISAWAKKSGYDSVWFMEIRDVGGMADFDAADYDIVGDVVVVFDGKQIKSVDNLNPTKNKDIRYSKRGSHQKKALEVFGTTTDYAQAGFVMADGKMLKLSKYGQQGVKHKNIEQVFDDVKGLDAVTQFLQEGNVRINASSPGIEIGADATLTTSQFNTISRFVSSSLRNRGVFYLDITDSSGNEVAAVEYDEDATAEDIIYDIKDYYDGGRVPRGTNAIRYSRRVTAEQDAQYLELAKDPVKNERALRDMLDEEAKKAFPNSILIQEGTFHKMWHHTNASFNSFLPGNRASSGRLRGIYFTPQEYSTMSNLGSVHNQYYLNVENVKFAFGVKADKVFVDQLRELQEGVTDRNEIAEINRRFKEETGVDAFFDWQNGWYNIMTPEQIKSADLVTYDDNGNVIPLSERFDSSNDDIRYSRRGTGISNRSLLANALEGATQNDIEAKRLAEYKKNIDLLNAEEQKLAEVRQKIHELSFAKGTRDTVTINNLQDTATRISNRISTYDKKLLNLEATAPLKALLEREKAMARKMEKQKAAEELAKYREDSAQTIREVMNRNSESRKKNVDSRKRTVTRNKIKRVVTDLNGLLNRGTKERNVKTDMQETVGSALKLANVIFNDDITNEDIVLMGSEMATEEEQVLLAQYKALIEKRDSSTFEEAMKAINKISTLNSKLSDLFKREKARLNNAKVSEAVDELAKAYSNLKGSDKDYVNFAYSEEAHKRLTDLSATLQGTIAKDMSLDQLEEVYNAYKMIRHMVRESNSLFRMGKTQDLAKTVTSVQEQILSLYKERNNPRAFAKKAGDLLQNFAWNEMKPLTAFETLGSDAYTELFWDAIKAEGEWAKWMEESKTFLDEQRDKFNYESWDMDSVHKFTLPDGKTFNLTLQEMLSIYAYSKREQAHEHMTVGGFQFAEHSEYKDGDGKKRVNLTSDLYVTDWTTIGKIIGELTDEQKQYADAVQKYLTDMGQRGNEVSEILYGIGIFNEAAYFPLMSSQDYRSSVEEALNNTPTQVSLKNTGMTKATVPNATNPIILQKFDDVAIGHIDKMAKYCTNVLAIENLQRVFNSSSADDNGGYVSTKAVIEKAFGKSAKKYIEQYITDLNGGTLNKGYNNPAMEWFSKFKGTAVGASLSVVVQQPFAVTRAMEIISPKHFIGEVSQKETKWLYDEIKRYAPVAVIKEMGGFDIESSRTAKEYLGVKTDKGLKRWVDEANDMAMWGAGKADELGWGIIWKAVKREVASNNEFKPGTAEFYEACGDRFTEVIVRTQVYDSVNSRSGMMRSKSDLNKFMTSFMGEPTTVINEAYLSMLNLSRASGKEEKAQARRQFGRTMGVLLTSTLLTTIAKSFVYAMRDDDDDEAFLEKWAKHTGDNLGLWGDLNPMTMLPFTRDIISIFEGFGVDRPDMTLIGNAIKSTRKLFDGASVDEVIAFIGDTANLFGVPAKNVIRDAKGIYNLFDDIFDDVQPTDMGGAFVTSLTGEDYTEKVRAENAFRKGNNAEVKRIAEGLIQAKVDSGKTENEAKSAVRSSFTSTYKKQYVKAYKKGDLDEMNRIRKYLHATGLYGSLSELDASLQKWRED